MHFRTCIDFFVVTADLFSEMSGEGEAPETEAVPNESPEGVQETKSNMPVLVDPVVQTAQALPTGS